MKFTKMHGLGNDYLYVYGAVPENVTDLCQRLSDRHFGAGSDGMIFIAPSKVADFSMRIFNADGSEAEMCGNGIRCAGKYVYEKGLTEKTTLRIETKAGIRELTLHLGKTGVESVSVRMGRAIVGASISLQTEKGDYTCIPVSVGNPHAVIFTEDVYAISLPTIGPVIERHPAFPDGANVEFAELTAPQTLRVRVWERGSGVTMACGTGACAVAAAAVSAGICCADEPMQVLLDGGTLQIRFDADRTIVMTGPAEFVYKGETCLC